MGSSKDIFGLPTVRKKVIYLDQFVYSEMMKALLGKAKGEELSLDRKRWLELFGKLDVLVRRQLIACPKSPIHEAETIVMARDEAPLMRLIEHLSGDVEFAEPFDVVFDQLVPHAEAWIRGNCQFKPKADPQNISKNKIHEWKDVFSIKVSFGESYKSGIRDHEKEQKASSYAGHKKIFSRWQTEKGSQFEDWYKSEAAGFGKAILKVYRRRAVRYLAILRGEAIPQDEDLFPPQAVLLVDRIFRIFGQAGVSGEDMAAKVNEYLAADDLLCLPFHRLSSALYAALARKAASGMKELLPSHPDDIQFISKYAPYCDAIFVDSQMYGFLNEPAVAQALDISLRVFSSRSLEQFEAYLDELMAAATAEHLAAIDEVYGDRCDEPNFQVLDEYAKKPGSAGDDLG